jgi:type IV pilus assembly protein PilB
VKQGSQQDLLGRKLVSEGVITEEQLEKALQSQELKKGEKGLLGRVLVSLGFCSEEDIARIIATRAGVEFVSLENYQADTAAMATVTPEVARRYNALPISFSDEKLVVAMKQPSDLVALDDLRILTGFNVRPVVVTDSELEAAIKNYSQFSVGIEQSVEEDDVAGDSDNYAAGRIEVSEEKPAVQLANVIISQAVNSKASDVHIEVYEKSLRVRFRIDGVLHDIMQPPRQIHAPLISRLKIMANMNIAERRIPQDGRMTLKLEGKIIDVRVASLPASFGERVTLRLLERTSRAVTLEELGIAPEVLKKYREAVATPYGFIPVTGPTGSGKSTTLYASLAAVDRVEKNVITVEDPVEYRMEGINQIQINPKAGLTFSSGLRSILRSDPDIIMVGEIRDKETARIAIESALTGHLVFTTLHTNDAAGAITRLTEMEIEPYLSASSLIGILAQRLARLLCPQCKEAYTITAETARQIRDFLLEPGEEQIKLYRAGQGGCMRCSKTGYSGRIGMYELLPVSERIQRLTLERKSAREIKQAAVEEGMITLRQDGMMKVKQGLTSIEEILRVIL